MLFSSITFLYCFLPCVLLVYFVVPDRLKNFTLLAASLIFYGWGEPKYLVFMLLSVTQSYIAALLVERFRGTCACSFGCRKSRSAGVLQVCRLFYRKLQCGNGSFRAAPEYCAARRYQFLYISDFKLCCGRLSRRCSRAA